MPEQMIPSKSECGLKRYLPAKPTMLGFKVSSKNGSSGIMHDFFFDEENFIYDEESSEFRLSGIVF